MYIVKRIVQDIVKFVSCKKHNLNLSASFIQNGENATRDKNVPCTICNKSDTDAEEGSDVINWFRCAYCKKWFHALCVNVETNEDYQKLKAIQLWFCPFCFQSSNFEPYANKVANQAVANITNSSITPTDGMIAGLITTEIQKLWPKIINSVKKELLVEVQKSTNYLETRITALEKELHSATSRLQSFENRSSRKNVLIQGVPESFDISDQTFILEIADEIGFKNLNLFDIDNVIRFRKPKNKTNEPKNKTNVSPALVMVSFVSQSVKQYFMDCYLGYIKN